MPRRPDPMATAAGGRRRRWFPRWSRRRPAPARVPDAAGTTAPAGATDPPGATDRPGTMTLRGATDFPGGAAASPPTPPPGTGLPPSPAPRSNAPRPGTDPSGPHPQGAPPPGTDLPPEADLLTRGGGRRAFRYGPRIVVPRRGRGAASRSGLRLLLRAGSGSLGAALFLGIFLGRALSDPGDTLVSVEFRGPGRLDPAEAPPLAPGFFTDPEHLRRQLAAAGPVGQVSVLGTGEGGARVVVEEKRAVAILLADRPEGTTGTGDPGFTHRPDATAATAAPADPTPPGPGGGPPLAIAADGALLGPATAADFAWAGAPDLPIVRGADPAAPDFAARAEVAGRLAAALAAAPDLDRQVSELRVAAAPARVEAVLRHPPGLVVVAAAAPDAAGSGSAGFTESLRTATSLLPDLLARWPDLERLDARLPDRLLALRRSAVPRSEPAPNPDPPPADPGAR